MPLSNTKLDEIEERRSEVWRLRVRGKSVRDIAKLVGVSHQTVQTDLEAVRKEIADETKQAALKHREIELARLDSWIETATTQLEAIPDLKDYIDGWDIKEKGLPPKIEQLAPILTALKGLSERRAKLLGLDAPVKQELSGPDGGPVELADAKSNLIAKLARLAIGKPSEGGPSEGDSTADSAGGAASTEDVAAVATPESDSTGG